MEIIKVFLFAMTPVGELRLAIPMGIIAYGMNPALVYFISLIGNLVPVFLILVFLGPFSDFLSKRFQFFYRFFSFLFLRTRNNHSSRVKKYGLLALVMFVAVPLPITGGWTASLVASIFGMPFKKAFSLIALGAAIAGVIVLLIVKAGIAIQDYMELQFVLGIGLLILFGFLFYKSRKNGKESFSIFK